jgi:tRNA wybutosine-synthesizing protein 4
MDLAENGERVYLRSLSSEDAKEIPSRFEKDFPSLQSDFTLPKELQYVLENAHSSPLRISGAVNMWLHYDVSLA